MPKAVLVAQVAMSLFRRGIFSALRVFFLPHFRRRELLVFLLLAAQVVAKLQLRTLGEMAGHRFNRLSSEMRLQMVRRVQLLRDNLALHRSRFRDRIVWVILRFRLMTGSIQLQL